MIPLASGNSFRRFSGKERGFSLFELCIAAVLISLVALVLLDRLIHYQDYAEQTAMEMTVVNMRSGLRWRVAELMIQEKMNEMATLVNQNPIQWLEKPPPNYLGDLNRPNPDTLAKGNWYFDGARHELVYVPKDYRTFEPWRERKPEVRYRVAAIQGAVQREDGVAPRIEWVKLVSLTP
jgi:general secretion pathway protein G